MLPNESKLKSKVGGKNTHHAVAGHHAILLVICDGVNK
jgi:hypothetical protein